MTNLFDEYKWIYAMEAVMKKIETDEKFEDKNLLKVDQFPKAYTIRDKYYPLIEANFPKNEKVFIKGVAKYRDRHIEELSTPYPTNYPVFGKYDSQLVFDCCKIDDDELQKDIDKTILPGTAQKKHAAFAPTQTVLLLMIKYYLDTKQEKKLPILYYYLGYSVYWMAYTNSFVKKGFLPRAETMIYTINNLSNKYILKQTGSIEGMIYFAIEKTIGIYIDRIRRASDYELFYIISAIKTRFANYMKKIAAEYYPNYEKGEVIFKSTDVLEDGSTREDNSVTNQVETLAQDYTTTFFGMPPRQDLINTIARMKSISRDELRTTLTIIIDKQEIDNVKRLYESIFYLYFNNNDSENKNVKSIHFLSAMEDIYKKGNTNDPNIIKLKEILNNWLKEGSITFRETTRPATQNDFRKGVFYYFIMLVSSNK